MKQNKSSSSSLRVKKPGKFNLPGDLIDSFPIIKLLFCLI